MKSSYVCLSCCQPFTPSPIREILEGTPLLCDECLSKIVIKLEERNTFGFKTLFLSNYDGIYKTWLMNFKEYGDVVLAPCFLATFLPLIRLRFPGRLFIPLPSSPDRVKKRGFAHLDLMLSSSHLPYQACLLKKTRKNRSGSPGRSGMLPRRSAWPRDPLLWPGKESSCLTMSLPPEPR
jgi:predicted amidophosphoribosyltransferase